MVLTAGLLAGTAKEAAAPWSDAKVNFVFWCANCLFGEGLRNEEATAAGTSRDLTGGGGSTPRSGSRAAAATAGRVCRRDWARRSWWWRWA